MKSIARVTLAALLVACSHNNNPTQPANSDRVALHTAESGDAAGVTLQLLRVENDSRCATGVQCVWAGDATVVFTVKTPTLPPATLAQQYLHTNIEPRSLEVTGYRVALDSLRPYPVAGHPIDQSEYVAFFTVSRVSGN